MASEFIKKLNHYEEFQSIKQMGLFMLLGLNALSFNISKTILDRSKHLFSLLDFIALTLTKLKIDFGPVQKLFWPVQNILDVSKTWSMIYW